MAPPQGPRKQEPERERVTLGTEVTQQTLLFPPQLWIMQLFRIIHRIMQLFKTIFSIMGIVLCCKKLFRWLE